MSRHKSRHRTSTPSTPDRSRRYQSRDRAKRSVILRTGTSAPPVRPITTLITVHVNESSEEISLSALRIVENRMKLRCEITLYPRRDKAGASFIFLSLPLPLSPSPLFATCGALCRESRDQFIYFYIRAGEMARKSRLCASLPYVPP